MLQDLREAVCEANRELPAGGLVTLTWGNVSGFDADASLLVIKPSGVPYGKLTPASMVVVDLDGGVVEGDLRPSSDTPTHARLYRFFAGRCPGRIAGITHTHSASATAFAQARTPVPCLGTTHADHFHGPVPLARPLTADEVDDGYEAATGEAIVERFADLDPVATPAVLLAGHAPFTWGATPAASVENAVALEAVAAVALATLRLRPDAPPLERHVLDKHHDRKHGAGAYYGQPASPSPS
ncbi:L-ribulose-5-phosphate 4-epimerase AraD [Phycisphaera mikurensis]|uniref:L-ribulose-5-phosphate 4-epimerase n=1 Tax=Phycisphaera mikurensis (strain NBRC 102666 / KCTC 22515 / FYK2301M01) TaxID=1142394 RepID=I0IIQ9_PHYMF|nr:L-ribulose-5-phosphate 4-epimerase AraD [Phycisphaera mikurensis]MBB6442702.1 L-ribulose-5-phosphate 4-epimerase [Phycisphaera mikurensis]BAM05147.1 L-ribulose-5-phosphate 4-epimerase [Phycisphaera mikurensis NBRC 102666]